MLSEKPINKWQRGLMSLLGYIDPWYWKLLWCLAERADDDGNLTISNEAMANAVLRESTKLRAMMKRMEALGLVKIVRKRKLTKESRPWNVIEKHPRLIGIYKGIAEGKVPEGADRYEGICPYWHYRGKVVPPQAHRLMRQKFKPRRRPKKLDFRHLSKWELMKLTPSAAYQHQREDRLLEKAYQNHYRQLRAMARRRYFLLPNRRY